MVVPSTARIAAAAAVYGSRLLPSRTLALPVAPWPVALRTTTPPGAASSHSPFSTASRLAAVVDGNVDGTKDDVKSFMYEDADMGASLFREDDDVYGEVPLEPLPLPEKRRPSPATASDIEENVKAAVLKYADPAVVEKLGGPHEWRSVPLDNLDLKFKVLMACNDNCNRRIPDFVISTVATAGNLATFLLENPIDEQERKYVPRVHQHFQQLKENGLLPPNLLFIPATVIDELSEMENPSIDSHHIPGYTDVPAKELPSARHLGEQAWRAEKPIPDVVDPDAWVEAKKLRRRPIPRHWI